MNPRKQEKNPKLHERACSETEVRSFPSEPIGTEGQQQVFSDGIPTLYPDGQLALRRNHIQLVLALSSLAFSAEGPVQTCCGPTEVLFVGTDGGHHARSRTSPTQPDVH